MPAGRIRRPFWLARPTRFAALKRNQARIALAVLAMLAICCLSALGAPQPTVGAAAALHQSVVEGIRHGGGFYSVTAEALRAIGGSPRAVATPLPLLATVQAWLGQIGTALLLDLLMVSVILAWFMRLRGEFQRGATLAPPLLVATGVMTALHSGIVALPPVWAGALIALSLALRRPGRWVEAVALALIAMLIDQTALLYVAVMALFALLERERREAAGWGLAVVVFAVALFFHLQAAAATLDGAQAASLAAPSLIGFGFFVATAVNATALANAPTMIAAPLIGLALAGWAAWRDPAGLRALAVILVYAALIGVAGRAETIGWALFTAPLLLLGLAFAPDAIGDLFHRALDRRRITVTRIGR